MASTYSTDLSLELVATGEKLVYGAQLQIPIYNYYNKQYQVM